MFRVWRCKVKLFYISLPRPITTDLEAECSSWKLKILRFGSL